MVTNSHSSTVLLERNDEIAYPEYSILNQYIANAYHCF